MKTSRPSATIIRRLSRGLWLAGLVALAGCSGANKLLDNLTGGKDEVLPGQREAVLSSNNQVSGENAEATDPIAIPAAVTNPSWGQPGGNASHSLHNLTLSRDLKRAFAVSAGAGSDGDGRLTASPIVSDGRVYVLDSKAVVRAFSATKGGKVWSASLVPEGKDGDGAYGGGLASDGGRIYATTAFGEIVALDAGSGNIVWRSNVGQPIRSAPTVADGRVYFTSVANDAFAYSTADGSQVWKYQGAGQQASILSSNSPAVSGGYVIVPYTTGDLLALEKSSGFVAWSESLLGRNANSSGASINDIAGRPVVADGAVYAISHSGRMAAFGLSDGFERWSVDIGGTQTPWVAGDYVFVIAGQNTMAAIARSNGGVRWSSNLTGGGVWSGPVVGGGRLLAVSSKGILSSVSPQTGELIKRIDIGEAVFIPPVIANGTVYILADDGTLLAYR